MNWMPVPDFEGIYEVSDTGEVVRIAANRGTRGGLLAARMTRKGYLRVALHRDGRRTDASIHRLVLAAFVGPGAGLEANHKNGQKADNRLVNLEWLTGPENQRHAVATGLRVGLQGVRNGRAKLTVDQVREIRTATGRLRDIGARYGVSHFVVAGIRNGTLWRSVA